jgi:cytochrome o ubiquinol oxidase subunit 2
MHFQVTALPQDRFGAWVDAARTGGTTLDSAAYEALARQSTLAKPIIYGSVDAGLFQKIVMDTLPPGPGPRPVPRPKEDEAKP